MSKLFPREFQKSVTLIASLKLSRLQLDGNASAPATSFVISLGFLNAIITAIYSGKNTVTVPKIRIAVKIRFTFPVFFIITAPPSYLRLSSGIQKLQQSRQKITLHLHSGIQTVRHPYHFCKSNKKWIPYSVPDRLLLKT